MKIDINKIIFKKITIEHIDDYLNLVSRVKRDMEKPDWLGDFTLNDYKYLLANGSIINGAYYNNSLIASFMLIPSTDSDLVKFNLEYLNSKDVIDYGPQMVDPMYIGNHIQSFLLKECDKLSRINGFSLALVTIHPDNSYSINNILNNEFKMVGEVELKRGRRNVYIKKL